MLPVWEGLDRPGSGILPPDAPPGGPPDLPRGPGPLHWMGVRAGAEAGSATPGRQRE